MSYNDDLRNKLKDYYGTAMYSGNPMAVVELSKVETASDAELEHLAKQAGIALTITITIVTRFRGKILTTCSNMNFLNE